MIQHEFQENSVWFLWEAEWGMQVSGENMLQDSPMPVIENTIHSLKVKCYFQKRKNVETLDLLGAGVPLTARTPAPSRSSADICTHKACVCHQRSDRAERFLCSLQCVLLTGSKELWEGDSIQRLLLLLVWQLDDSLDF